MHIHLHAASQKHFASKTIDVKDKRISRVSLAGLADSLTSLVRRTEFRIGKTEWGEYYQDTNYSGEAFEHKKAIIAEFLDIARPIRLWDLGANTGVFSRMAGRRRIDTVAFDVDFAAVERNYRECRAAGETHLLPLVLDLTNPSPSSGWGHTERRSWLERGPVDAVFALALIHHLAISNNLPFSRISPLFAGICRWLVIEFIPKDDSQVRRLLATREDIFTDYTQPAFESAFGGDFFIRKAVPVRDSQRTMYLMEARHAAEIPRPDRSS